MDKRNRNKNKIENKGRKTFIKTNIKMRKKPSNRRRARGGRAAIWQTKGKTRCTYACVRACE